MGIINKEMKIYKVTFGSTFYFFIKNNFFFCTKYTNIICKVSIHAFENCFLKFLKFEEVKNSHFLKILNH